MRFRVLGRVDAADGQRRVVIGSARQRLILAVLLAERGQVASADRLIDAVWGPTPPASARKSLHSHVSRLRRALAGFDADAGGAVRTEADGYRVDTDRHAVDADRFEALLELTRGDAGSGRRARLDHLDEALGLWRGPAFGELADHELIRTEAVRLEQRRAAAAAERVELRLSLGEHRGVIGELEAVVAGDPLAESPHGQLMLALYRSGRQADALAVYRRLQHRLREEVGVDPSPQLRELHERILRQDPELAAPVPPTAAAGDRRADVGPGGGLPPAPVGHTAASDLVGRGEDVDALAGLVTSSPLVTLTGPGGVGKSLLAEAVAAAVGDRFDDGAVLCGLAGLSDPDGVPSALLDALGVHAGGTRPRQEVLLAALGPRRLLLVIDNCEHLLDAVAQTVERVRDRCPHVRVLATSREHLRVPGEQVWPVSPLPVPPAEASADEVAASAAGWLFCLRARAAAPAFELTEANAATIAELCRRLDGMPLAIELAAARIRALAPEDLAERMEHRLDLLTGGPGRESGRHRTLRAVVAWSYELLTEREARLFDRLSVFAGGFSLPAAEQVCAGEPIGEQMVAGLLAELVDKSLVAVDRGGGEIRYRLLETLRTYGAERLEEDADDAEDVRWAHAAYHLALAEELGARVRGPDEQAALARLDAALADLRIAHDHLVAAGDVDGALGLPAALHDDLVFRPRPEVFGWVERALELPGATGSPAYPAALAIAARGAIDRGELDRTRQLAETALAGAEPEGLAALWALYLLTTAALYEGRLDDVLDIADRRIGLADTLGDDYHRALALVSRVLGHLYHGDGQAAVDTSGRARAAAESSGNHRARAWALYASGEARVDRDPGQAVILLEQAIEAARRVDSRLTEGVALVSLASLCGRGGKTRRALALFRETVLHWRRLGDYTHQLTTLRNLVDLFVRVGADEAAAVLHGAVTLGATPSFGVEAERLAVAWEQVERRLGHDAARVAAEHGRHLPLTEMVDTALAQLDALLDGDQAPPRS